MDKKRGDADWSSVVKSSAIGAGGSMVITLSLTALAAGLIGRGTIEETSLNAVTAGILLLSAVCGALLAVSIARHQRLTVCMATGAVYFLMLMGCSMLLFDGVNGTVGVTALLILGGACAALLLGLKEGRVGKRRLRLKK